MDKFFSILTHNFSVLKNRTIRIYISGQGVSLLGTWMQQTAQSWVVWQLSHTATALGTIALVSQIPFFLLGPWAGSWADRLNRRSVLIATQTISMFLAFMLAFLVQTHLVQLWHVYVLASLLTGFLADVFGITKIIFSNGVCMVILAAFLIWGKPIVRKLIASINPDELVEEYEPPLLPTKI